MTDQQLDTLNRILSDPQLRARHAMLDAEAAHDAALIERVQSIIADELLRLYQRIESLEQEVQELRTTTRPKGEQG